MDAEPSICPTSIIRMAIPSHTLHRLHVLAGSEQLDRLRRVAGVVQRFLRRFALARILRAFHSASISWICAESISMMAHKSSVASVVKIFPRETSLVQKRQPAAVVDMRVRQKHAVHSRRGYGQRGVFIQIVPLLHPVVHEEMSCRTPPEESGCPSPRAPLPERSVSCRCLPSRPAGSLFM